MCSRGAKILALLADAAHQNTTENNTGPVEFSQLNPMQGSDVKEYAESVQAETVAILNGDETIFVSTCDVPQHCDSDGGGFNLVVNSNTYKENSENYTAPNRLFFTATEDYDVQSEENLNLSDNSVDDENYAPTASDPSTDEEPAEVKSKKLKQNKDGEKRNEKGNSIWKQAKPKTWKRQKNKQLKSDSLPYLNYKGIQQIAKAPKPIDCSKCKFDCTSKFNEDERKAICQKYWKLTLYERKKDFILYNVSSSVPTSRRPRKENAIKRQTTKRYSFNKNNNQLQVCQQFFLKTLCISNRVVLIAFRDKDELGHFSGIDKRGRRSPANKTKENVLAKVRAHIESFPCMESHYTRKSSVRKYLDSNLTIAKMYNLYKEQCEERKDTEIVSSITYRRIFGKEYNLSFFHPKKDQCLTCTTYKQATPDLKPSLEESYNNHLRRKEQAQEAKQADKDRAKSDPSFMTVSFDLQSVLQIPSSEISLTYYLRKLCMYNLTVYEAASSNRAFCFCWTEINGKKGSSEIGTCLVKYIKTLPPEIKEISLFSDTCGGQNRNLHISALFLFLVQNTQLDVIEQKFLESGHSFMEVDSMHSAIERQKKFVSIFCVNDWINIFKLARSNRGRNKEKPPYEASELKFDEFLDLKTFSSKFIKNKSLDKNGQKVKWLQVKCFRYEKAKPNILQYRYDYNSDYCEINIGTKRRVRKPIPSEPLSTEEIPLLYSEPLKISKLKKDNLLTMCKKKIIPEVFHPWITSLPCASDVLDVLPEPDINDSDREFEEEN